MNRTRGIFLAVLIVSLGVVVVSLLLQVISQTTAMQIFVATTVFSVGVVLLDFLGILGGHHDANGGDVTTAGHFGDSPIGHAGDLGSHFDAGATGAHFGTAGDTGHVGGAVHDGAGGATHGDEATAAGHAAEAVETAHDAESTQHEAVEQSHTVAVHHAGAPILSVLSYLRLVVYFCLGFGPTGWVAMATGRDALGSMVYAAPAGVASLLIARAFFRFQRRDTDSQIRPSELISQSALVIIPLDDKTMGKVRIQIGMNVTEQYALSAVPGRAFKKGDQVRVSKVTEECLFVR